MKANFIFIEFHELLSGEWPSGLKHCNQNWKFHDLNPSRHSIGLRDPSDLQVKSVKMQ